MDDPSKRRGISYFTRLQAQIALLIRLYLRAHFSLNRIPLKL